MIRTILFSSLLLVGCSFIQSTWLGAIAFLGVVPDLALVVLIWISYKNGLVEGPVSGFLSGLAEDAISAAPFGFNAFVKTLTAALAGLLHGSFYIDRLLFPFLLGVAGTLVKAVGAGFLALLFGGGLQSYDFLGRSLWLEAAYNGVVAPLLFLLLGLARSLLVTESKRE